MKLAHIGTAVPPREDRDWVLSDELLRATGITYRQLDYWCRTNLLTTLDGNAPGSGWARRFPEDQVRRARAIAALLTAGVSLPVCRDVIDDLLEHGQATSGHVTFHLHLDPTGDNAA